MRENEEDKSSDLTIGRILEKLEQLEEKQDAFGERIGHLEDNLKAAVWVFRTIKYLFLGLIALITFNWTSALSLLERFKNG